MYTSPNVGQLTQQRTTALFNLAIAAHGQTGSQADFKWKTGGNPLESSNFALAQPPSADSRRARWIQMHAAAMPAPGLPSEQFMGEHSSVQLAQANASNFVNNFKKQIESQLQAVRIGLPATRPDDACGGSRRSARKDVDGFVANKELLADASKRAANLLANGNSIMDQIQNQLNLQKRQLRSMSNIQNTGRSSTQRSRVEQMRDQSVDGREPIGFRIENFSIDKWQSQDQANLSFFDLELAPSSQTCAPISRVAPTSSSILINSVQSGFTQVFFIGNPFRWVWRKTLGRFFKRNSEGAAGGGGDPPPDPKKDDEKEKKEEQPKDEKKDEPAGEEGTTESPDNNDEEKNAGQKEAAAAAQASALSGGPPKPFTEEQIAMADPAADILVPKFMELKQETVDRLFEPSDGEYRARKQKIFLDVDKDGDGVLNEEEYIDLQLQNIDLWREQYGEAPNITRDELKRVYAIQNEFNKSYDGLTLEDFRQLSEALVRNPKLKLTRRGDVSNENDSQTSKEEPKKEAKSGQEDKSEQPKDKKDEDKGAVEEKPEPSKEAKEEENAKDGSANSASENVPEAKTTDTKEEGTEDDPLDKVKEFFGFKKDGEETENPIEQIKALGVAGAISYALWEAAFWTVGGAGAVLAYYYAFGHWPDFNNQEDTAKLGAEAFAFINIARFIVPLRIGLAVGTAPWVDENIVRRFNLGKKDEALEPTDDKIKAVVPGMKRYLELFEKLSPKAQEALADNLLKQEAKENYEKCFKEADKDGNGQLSREEYGQYLKLMADYQKDKAGEAIEWTDEDIDFVYKSINGLDPDKDGVGIDDFEKCQVVLAIELSKTG